jgi:ubiquinone biosynthesis protein
VGVVREFSRLLHRELDLVREGRATDRLRQFFEDDPEIHFTQVYWEATTKKVLALEEVQGLLLADVQPETLTQAERHRAVKRGTDAVFRMCLELGFFHADPHPGNIFLLPDGGVCFIDCGLVGYLDTRTIEQLASLARAVSCADLDQTLRLTLALTDADPSLENNQALRAEAWDLIAQFQADSLEQLDLGETLEGLFEVFKKYQIRCPSNLVFLIKALATVQGVALELDPKFDWLEHTRPFIERMVARQYGPTALLNRLWRSTLNYVELAEDLPNEIRTISAQIRRRDFSIRLEHDGLERLKNTVDRASRHISTALILAAMLISGALLLRSDATLVWWSPVTWLLAGLYAVAAGYVAFLILGPLTSKD